MKNEEFEFQPSYNQEDSRKMEYSPMVIKKETVSKVQLLE